MKQGNRPSHSKQNFSHEQVFGHLACAEFTVAESAEYLDVSISTFCRYVADGKIPVSKKLFAAKDLKAFKRSRS
jgi:hypothetical protein